MKLSKLVFLATILLITACTEPFVTIPGGQLKGKAVSAPSSWDSVSEVVQLEVRPSDPYSLNIWAVTDNGNLYVATTDSKWVGFIADNDEVRVKIEMKLHELHAVHVDDTEELARIAAAYTKKYEVDPSDNWVEGANVYRLVTR